jgi:hypothetical protein
VKSQSGGVCGQSVGSRGQKVVPCTPDRTDRW